MDSWRRTSVFYLRKDHPSNNAILMNFPENFLEIRVEAGKLSGWFAIDVEGNIVRCSRGYGWAIHLNYVKLLKWIKKKTPVKLTNF